MSLRRRSRASALDRYRARPIQAREHCQHRPTVFTDSVSHPWRLHGCSLHFRAPSTGLGAKSAAEPGVGSSYRRRGRPAAKAAREMVQNVGWSGAWRRRGCVLAAEWGRRRERGRGRGTGRGKAGGGNGQENSHRDDLPPPRSAVERRTSPAEQNTGWKCGGAVGQAIPGSAAMCPTTPRRRLHIARQVPLQSRAQDPILTPATDPFDSAGHLRRSPSTADQIWRTGCPL